jgi:AraC-like DNA-binding protein/tetratricopeptide (TPR) repeat protein
MEHDRQKPSTPLPRAVKAAVALMRDRIGEPLKVTEIARRCGVAERTLNAQFRAFLDTSPARYLRQLRLAAAREALLEGRPSVTSVSEVAQRCGFRHFGRFARHYQQCFGETPSATLSPPLRPDAILYAFDGPRARLRSRERPTLAVAPLAYPAEAPTLRSVAYAIAEGLAVALTAIRSLDVRFTSARHGQDGDTGSPRRPDGARYLLAGSLIECAGRLRLTLRLVEAHSGRHVWGETFTDGAGALLRLQDQLVTAVPQSVASRILETEMDRAWRTTPADLDAHGLAMRALALVLRSQPDAARQALDLLYSAIERDPDYALTAALAAWAHAQLVMYNGSTNPAADRDAAQRLNRRAALLDDADALVLTARSAVHTMAGEFDHAAALVARALAIDPTSGCAWGRSAWLHAYAGDYGDAIDRFRRSLSLGAPDGARANALVGLGSAYFGSGRYAEATACLQRAVLENPGMWWANRSLSVSLARLGERRRALASMTTLRRACPDLTVSGVVGSVPFRSSFLERLGNGLDDLGLPP